MRTFEERSAAERTGAAGFSLLPQQVEPKQARRGTAGLGDGLGDGDGDGDVDGDGKGNGKGNGKGRGHGHAHGHRCHDDDCGCHHD
jgi:hypothetical protein